MGWRFNGNELKYLKEVLDSDFKSSASGNMLARFESKFAETVGIKYVIGTNSGTSALHEALAACDVGPGDEVIIPSLTVIMCGFAVLYLGARPVFADVRPDTFLIDPDDIERKLTPRTKAIMAVHMYGQVCDMDRILAIAKRNNLFVIEDCAQCYLGRDNKGRVAGTIGDIGCFSLSDTKTITTGEGGIVITNNEFLANRIRKFAYLGFKNLNANNASTRVDPMIFQNPRYLRHDAFSFSHFMSEPAAAIALAQTERIVEFHERRVRMGNLYRKAIGNCRWLLPQQVPEGHLPSYWTFTALYKGTEELGINWYKFRNKFIEMSGDKVRACWALVYNEPAMRNILKYGRYFEDSATAQSSSPTYWQEPNCPKAEYLQPRLMSFTTNQKDEAEMQRQAEALKRTVDWLNSEK